MPQTTVTLVSSSAAGVAIAANALVFRVILGQTLGISGMLNHVLKRDGHWSGLFVVGLVLAGLLQLRYATIPWSPELHLESPFWALLGGILVSLGTKLSGGCTSGHGICGLSRVSIRSWISAPLFVGFAMLARCLKMIYLDYSFTAPLPMQVEAIDALIDPAVSPILGSAMALIPICFAMSGWVRRHQIPLISRGVLVLVCGVSFGSALFLGGMGNPDKVNNFLSLPSLFFLPSPSSNTIFDPSLALVLACGMLPNLLLHPLINWVMQRPAWFDSWELPTRKDVDWKLVVGSMLFGVGWGVSGLCPGPALILFIPSLLTGRLNMLRFFVGYFLGLRLAGDV